MTGVEMPIALPWLTFAATWLVLGIAVSALHRVGVRRLAAPSSEQRAALLLALALLPPVAAAFAAVLGFAPRIGGLLVDRHCHADGCWPHVPTLHADIAYAVPLAAALLVGTGTVLWMIGGRLRRSLSFASLLRRVAARQDREPFELIETPERLACCVGLLRPRVLVSRGLLDALAPAELRVVVAHERAHAVRLDNLRQLAAAVALWPVPRSWRHGLLAELALANELACDRAAAALAGSADAVRAALLALRPRSAERPRRARAGFAGGGALDRRLAALAAPDRPGWPPGAVSAVVLALYVATVLSVTSLAHHGVEWLLAAFG